MSSNISTCAISQASYNSLLDVYSGFHGEYWVYENSSQSWTFPSPLSDPCSIPWQGVFCNSTISGCEITSLQLQLMNLSGTISSQISGLSHLEHFNIVANYVYGGLPDSMGSLTSLTTLLLSFNSITHTLPSAWGAMKSLQFLDISASYISGSLPESWSAMSSINRIILHHNLLHGKFPNSWSTLTTLIDLNVFSNSLTGTLPISWSKLDSLQVMDFGSNSLSGSLPSQWSRMTSLQALYTQRNHITGTLPTTWSTISTMEVLYLFHSHITGLLPTSWSTMTKLQVVFLDLNSLSGTLPHSWSTMNKLQVLYVDFNSLSGTLPEEWNAMSQLRLLFFDHNSLFGFLPQKWNSLSNLLFIRGTHNSFQGQIPTCYCTWSGLQVLYLSENMLSGTIHMCWKQLQDIDVSNNFLTFIDLSSQNEITALRELNISFNSLHQGFDTSLVTLTSLPFLTSLDISRNYITGQIKFLFGNSNNNNIINNNNNTTISTVDVSDNCLSTNIDISVCKLLNLTSFLASSMYNTKKCSDVKNTWFIDKHAYPSCVLQLPKISNVNLVGNAMTGSLVDIDPLSSRLSFVGLVSNRITGTLPESWQRYGGFDQLLLSFNKISGALRSDFIVQENMTNLNMSINRISGTLPSSFGKVGNSIDVIDGNIISCESQRIYEQGKDVSRTTYECGSLSLDVVGYVCACVGVVMVGFMWGFPYLKHDLESLVSIVIQQYHHNITIIKVLCISAVSMFIVILNLSTTYTWSMYYFEYGWMTTAAYLHGFASIAVLFIELISIASVLYVVGRTSTSGGISGGISGGGGSTSSTSSTSKPPVESSDMVTYTSSGGGSISTGLTSRPVESSSMVIGTSRPPPVTDTTIVSTTSSNNISTITITNTNTTTTSPSTTTNTTTTNTTTITTTTSPTTSTTTTTSTSGVLSTPVKVNHSRMSLLLCLYHLCNVSLIGGMTVLYVYLVLSHSTRTTQLLCAIVLGIIKVMWGELYIPRVYQQTIFHGYHLDINHHHYHHQKSFSTSLISWLYPMVLRHEVIADVWCYMLCPLIVIVATSSTCYRYALSGMSTITLEYTSDEAIWTLTTFVIRNNVTTYVSKDFVTVNVDRSIQPPWLYSFQCSSSIIASYVSVVYYSYIIYALLVPFIKIISLNFAKYTKCRFTLVSRILGEEHTNNTYQYLSDRILMQSIHFTSVKHRTHIRHYIMFLVFGLSSPLLGLLITLTILIQDSVYLWEVSKLKEYLLLTTSYNISEVEAKILCEGLQLPDVSNVYHRYLPWVSLISVGYWGLYTFDTLGDVHGEYVGLVSAVVYISVSLLVVLVVVVVVGPNHTKDIRKDIRKDINGENSTTITTLSKDSISNEIAMTDIVHSTLHEKGHG